MPCRHGQPHGAGQQGLSWQLSAYRTIGRTPCVAQSPSCPSSWRQLMHAGTPPHATLFFFFSYAFSAFRHETGSLMGSQPPHYVFFCCQSTPSVICKPFIGTCIFLFEKFGKNTVGQDSAACLPKTMRTRRVCLRGCSKHPHETRDRKGARLVSPAPNGCVMRRAALRTAPAPAALRRRSGSVAPNPRRGGWPRWSRVGPGSHIVTCLSAVARQGATEARAPLFTA